MANLDKTEKRRTQDWLVRLDTDLKQMADDVLKERLKNGLTSPAGKERDSYRDLFKASFRDKEHLQKLKTWKFNKDV